MKESSMEAVRRLIDHPFGFDPDVWGQGAALGWASLLVPDRYGGAGSDQPVRDVAVLAEEFGRLVQPGPLIANAVVGYAVATFGTDDQRRTVLPGIVSGAETAAWCLADGGNGWDPAQFDCSVADVDDGYMLSGSKNLVQDAHAATHLLVTANRSSGPIQLLLPAGSPGVSIEPLEGLDLTRRFFRVRFDEVKVPRTASLGTEPRAAGVQWKRQFELALVMHCAETVGAMDRIFETTLDYANERFAFGRPIGSFQAIKHMLADMYGWLESAKAISCAATDAVHSGTVDVDEVVSAAKAYIGEYAPRLVQQCLQVYGGIGYTWEHDIHLYLRRVKSNEVLYGSPDWHRDHLVQLAENKATSAPSLVTLPTGQTGVRANG